MNSTDWKFTPNANMLRKGLFSKFLSILFFICFTLQCHVLNAQSIEKLTLTAKNIAIEEVLNQIENQSKYRFLYNKHLIDVERKITVKFIQEYGCCV